MKVDSSQKAAWKPVLIKPWWSMRKTQTRGKPSSASQVYSFSHLERFQKRGRAHAGHKAKATSHFPSQRGRNLAISSCFATVMLIFQAPQTSVWNKQCCLGEEGLGQERYPRKAGVTEPASPHCLFISGRKQRGLPRLLGLSLIHRKLLSWLNSHWARGSTFHLSFQATHPTTAPRAEAGGLFKQSRPPTTTVGNLQSTC